MSLVLYLILAGVALLIPTAYAAKIGAPYAPTRLPAVRRAFEIIKLGSSDMLIDIGAGDGSILFMASQVGARARGYELSPIMWVIIWLRMIIRREKNIKIKFANFYRQALPLETTVLFAFLMPQNMGHVKEFLKKQNLPHAKYFLAYAFPLPNTEPWYVVHVKNCARLYIYKFQNIRH